MEKSIEKWEDKAYLTVRDIQHILGISYGTATNIARELPRIIIGERCKRIPTEAFKKYLAKHSSKGTLA